MHACFSPRELISKGVCSRQFAFTLPSCGRIRIWNSEISIRYCVYTGELGLQHVVCPPKDHTRHVKFDTVCDSHLSAIQARHSQETMTQASVYNLRGFHWLPSKCFKLFRPISIKIHRNVHVKEKNIYFENYIKGKIPDT